MMLHLTAGRPRNDIIFGQDYFAIAGQRHLIFRHFSAKTTRHREALSAEAIFSQTKDCFAEKRSQ
jgi:hypothetical protein